MASSNCWRCLARPSQRLLTPAARTTIPCSAAFTTTAAQLADKNDAPLSRHIRSGKRLVLGKKKRQPERGKPPAPGERKAFRKRVQLSNDNALAVPGQPELSAENIIDPAAEGRVVRIPDRLVDQLRTCEAFKPTQNWGLFRAPHMLVRKETVDLLKPMTEAVGRKETFRAVVTGDKGSGKSVLGLQALANGFLNNWVVINIPEAQDLTTAHTDYAPIPNSDIFSQPSYIIKLMQSIYEANKDVLSKQTVGLDHIYLPVGVSRNTTLAALANATKEPDFAWPVFMALWKELLLPGRPPILFNLDGLCHIMHVSDYRSPSFAPIHSHDLGLIRLFVDALGGKTEFPNGAAITGIMTESNKLKIKSVEDALAQARAAQSHSEIPQRDPFYSKYDERVFEVLKGVRVFDIQGVSKPEARALMEYWAASGILRARVDERSVGEKWTLAGHGLLGEMERASLFAVRL